jgi:Integrase core domain
MNPVAYWLLLMLRSCFRTRASLQIEILALRHQLGVLQRQQKRVSLRATDRLLWVVISRLWKQWHSALLIVKPETVIAWQNAYAERFIGSLRRECLDHIIIFNEASLKRILKTYFEYYEHSRPHLSLEKDAPTSRAVQTRNVGRVIKLPQVGGLHHRYERRAA